MGREEPAVSMDGSGKLIWARHNDVVSAIIKGGGTAPSPAPLFPTAELLTDRTAP